MKKQTSDYLKIILLTVAFVALASYAKAWTGPSQAAPNGNTPAPLNIGSTVQTKLGSLVINAATPIQNAIGLTVFGTTTLNGGLTIADGSQGAGKVLMSDDSGNVSWQVAGTESPFLTDFVLKRSAPYPGDAVSWCPATHPNVVFCSTVAGDAPAAASFSALTLPKDNKGNSCLSDGSCNQTGLRTSSYLGQDNQYFELVRNGSQYGCLVYDNGHSHTKYDIDLICSK